MSDLDDLALLQQASERLDKLIEAYQPICQMAEIMGESGGIPLMNLASIIADSHPATTAILLAVAIERLANADEERSE